MTGRHVGHSIFSASSASRWAGPDGCFASVILSALVGGGGSSDAADAGTRAHELIERRLTRQPVDVSLYDSAARAGADLFISTLESFRRPDTHCEFETQLLWHYRLEELGRDAVYGFADAVLYTPSTRTLCVMDYKHGKMPVSAVGNKQLLHYICGALDTFNLNPHEISNFVAVIVQPNNRMIESEPGSGVEIWEPSRDDVLDFRAQVYAAVNMYLAARDNGGLLDEHYNPSAENCRWCPAFWYCSAAAEVPFNRAMNVPLKAMTPQQKADLLPLVALVRSWARRVEADLLHEAMSGLNLPNYKLVASQSREYKLIVPESTLLRSLAQYGLDEDDLLPRVLVSYSKLKTKLTQKLRAQRWKPHEIQEACDKLQSYYERLSDGYILAPVKDPRPAVDVSASTNIPPPPK